MHLFNDTKNTPAVAGEGGQGWLVGAGGEDLHLAKDLERLLPVTATYPLPQTPALRCRVKSGRPWAEAERDPSATCSLRDGQGLRCCGAAWTGQVLLRHKHCFPGTGGKV